MARINKIYPASRLWWVERLFNLSRDYIQYVQLLMLLGFLVLVVGPLLTKVPHADDTVLTNLVLLSQFLFWGVWYGACLLSVIPFGRLWCGVLCPLGALSQWVGKIGLQRTLPRWLRWHGWLVVMFVVVTILGQTMDVRDDPAGMAKLFLYIFVMAIVLGLLYGKKNGRPWCRYFCPIGKILGVVSRLGMIDFKPNQGIRLLPEGEQAYVQGRLCPTDYNLPYKNSTHNCITCGACSFGKQRAGLGIYRRPLGQEIQEILLHEPNWSEVIFILLSPGLSAGGFLWLILHQYQLYRDAVGSWLLNHNMMWFFHHAPSWISSQRWDQHYNWLDVFMISAYMLSYSLVIGVISTILIALAAFCLRSPLVSFKNRFVMLTYQFTPVAILSIVIGLCGKFFQVMQQDFNLPAEISAVIKFALLAASMMWAIYLAVKAIKKLNTARHLLNILGFCMVLLNIGLLLAMWWPAILGHSYMSEVEKIRQHIIIPGVV